MAEPARVLEKNALISATGLEKFYLQPDGRRVQVIAPTDLAIYPDQIITLLGSSGCGKSTMLRMLCGLTQPSGGAVLWHGTPVTNQIRNVSIVFQSFALFPWLTVLENVEAPLAARGQGPVERRKRALKILDTVGLDGFETAYPKELSGGMKQRVGFARALVVEPEILFMDEPFSALDVLTAENLRGELMELWLSRKIPTRAIFIVTHNIEEAILLADRVLILGRNPALIRADFEVALEQPRDRKSREFVELVDHTYKVLTHPTLEVTTPGSAAEHEGKTDAHAVAKYETLPHARTGSVAGLLGIVLDRGGKEDLYRLADQLTMEVDDLLPIVEGAALLGFVQLKEGDVEILEAGRTFFHAEIQERKSLFREAALKHVTILRQIDHALRARSDGSMPDDFFLDVLEEHFSEEEAKRQFQTAVAWGRYAELFDYDAQTGRVFRTERL